MGNGQEPPSGAASDGTLPLAHRFGHPGHRKQLLYSAPHRVKETDNGEPAILRTSRGTHGTHVRRGWAEVRQVRERNTIDSPTD